MTDASLLSVEQGKVVPPFVGVASVAISASHPAIPIPQFSSPVSCLSGDVRLPQGGGELYFLCLHAAAHQISANSKSPELYPRLR